MFLPSSRYANIAQCQLTQADGSTVTAVKLRMLPEVTGDPTAMTADDQLDVIAGQEYNDGTMFWHIADANSELYAPNLLELWLPGDPDEGQITIAVPEQ